ncbi:MAG: transporter [Candidatus Ratteibacteria bacterium]|jgi:hypothetical protein
MLQRIKFGLFVTGIVVLLSSVCFSQENSLGQEEEWGPPSTGPITASTAPLCEKGKLVVQPFFFYTDTRGGFDSHGYEESLPVGDSQSQWLGQLSLYYGLTDRLEIDISTAWQENYIKQGGLSASSGGIGDTCVTLKRCFCEENGSRPHITGLLQIKAPTGQYQHGAPGKMGTDLTGSGSWDYSLGMVITKKIKPFIFHADVIYSIPQETTIDDIKIQYGDYLNYDFAVECFFPKKGPNLVFEINGFQQDGTKEDGGKVADSDGNFLAATAGFGWSNDNIQTLLGYQRVLTGENADANDSVILTCVYTF